MSERTDALIVELAKEARAAAISEAWQEHIKLAAAYQQFTDAFEALRAEIVRIEAERDALRERLMEYQQAAKMDEAPVLRNELQQARARIAELEAAHGSAKAVIAELRKDIAELEARLTPVKFSERKPVADQVVLLWNSFYKEWVKGTPWIPDPLESDDDYLRFHYPLWLPMPPAPEEEA